MQLNVSSHSLGTATNQLIESTQPCTFVQATTVSKDSAHRLLKMRNIWRENYGMKLNLSSLFLQNTMIEKHNRILITGY